MIDPISIFQNIKEGYISYVKTAFGTRYKSFETKREALLNQDRVLYRQPWVEPLFEYLSADGKEIQNLTIEDLPGLNESQARIFRDFVSLGLFKSNYPLYLHQYEMLQHALNGNNCVITSGTGSGKTESFLLPLFAYLLKDIAKYIQKPTSVNPNSPVQTSFTTRSEDGKLPHNLLQRNNESRPCAVKALIVYPMNALVEDQMTRMRDALDNDDIRSYCNENLNGHRIFYGRYNSSSPVAGNLFKPNDDPESDDTRLKISNAKQQKLKKELRIIQSNYDKTVQYIDHEKGLTSEEKTELLNNFQRLDGAEMRSRYDMQATPPDILITNFSMLSIMLMRSIEDSIFEETRLWLKAETEWDLKNLNEEVRASEQKERIFHIVVDELHLYRGSTGTEIAYLLRLLYNRLGVDPNSNKIRILASSASLDGKEGSKQYKDSQGFLKGFFASSKDFKVVMGQYKPYSTSNSSNSNLKESDFIEIGKIIENSIELEAVYKEISSHFYPNSFYSADHIISLLKRFNDDVNLKSAVASSFKDNDDIVRPFPFYNKFEDEAYPSIGKKIFGADNYSPKEIRRGIHGLFFIRGLFDYPINKDSDGKTIVRSTWPRFRFHFFYRNIEGLWSTLISKYENSKGSLLDVDPIDEVIHHSSISYLGKRVFETLYCECCGTILIGGTRVVDSSGFNGEYNHEIITVPPEIEKIPEKSQSARVELKTAKDYAVFWPNQSEKQIKGWHKRYINVINGRLYYSPGDGLLKGYYYDPEVIQNSNLLQGSALSPVCPSCDSDYTNRRKQSPIRGFRTGFGKTNQVLAKELFTSLPDLPKKPRKLVVFSDSREEAARFSNDIEKENYYQLIKEFLLEGNKLADNVIRFIKQVESNSDVNVELPQSLDGELIRELANKKLNRNYDKDLIEDYLNHTVRIDDLLTNIITSFLKMGLNPAGPSASAQMINISSDKPAYEAWDKCYDWTNLELDSTKIGSQEVRNRININTKKALLSEIGRFAFGKLFYSLEASGIGVIKIKSQFSSPLPMLSNDQYTQIVNSTVRILGDSFRYSIQGSTLYDFNSCQEYKSIKKVRLFIEAVSEHLLGSQEYDVLGTPVWNSITAIHSDGVLKLDLLKISFVSEENRYYKCNNCGTVHLHRSADVCKSCFAKGFVDSGTSGFVSTLRDSNYYSKTLLESKSIRLRCEELTGQTDNQLERQRKFRGIILGDNKKVQEIDLLSVTTTLEVGVDIGSLQAVYQGNMSPMRFNYQQRVGRAGRAGQAYNIAMTYCRGRNHDEFFFNHPERMTGDVSPVPFLSQTQSDILYRMIIKGVFQRYFSNIAEDYQFDSVHGEFGTVENFFSDDSNVDNLFTFLDSNLWQDIFLSLTQNLWSTNVKYESHSMTDFISWLNSNFKEKFLDLSDQYSEFALSEAMAEVGLLPMAGMPTGQRNLITGFNKQSEANSNTYEPTTISRPLDRAIFDFAPGAQKTKDKRIFTSIGITPSIRNFSKNWQTRSLEANLFNRNAFTGACYVVINTRNNILETRPVDSEHTKESLSGPDLEVFEVVIPNAFRTDWHKRPQDREVDQEISSSRPILFSQKINGDNVEDRLIGNSKLVFAPTDFTWRINNNERKEFSFMPSKLSPYRDVEVDNQYIDIELDGKLGASGLSESINSTEVRSLIRNSDSSSEGVRKLSLGAKKVTNVFRISPNSVSLQLDINPFSSDDAKKVASKGAYYSAAFILQRILADNRDVAPEEIELAAITEVKLESGGMAAEIVLADELPNGSGFVEYLYRHYDFFMNLLFNVNDRNDFTKSFINEEHMQNCKTACYQDLQNYRNLNYHGILDWRLGLSLLRIFNDDTYLVGLDNDWSSIEISDWKEEAYELATQLASTIDQSISKEEIIVSNGIPIIRIESYSIIVVHPLWNYINGSLPEDNSLSKAIVDLGLNTQTLFFADTFNIKRRLSFVYSNFMKMVDGQN